MPRRRAPGPARRGARSALVLLDVRALALLAVAHAHRHALEAEALAQLVLHVAGVRGGDVGAVAGEEEEE